MENTAFVTMTSATITDVTRSFVHALFLIPCIAKIQLKEITSNVAPVRVQIVKMVKMRN